MTVQRLRVFRFNLNLKSRQSVGDHLGFAEMAIAASPQAAIALIQQAYGSDLTGVETGPSEVAGVGALAADSGPSGPGVNGNGGGFFSSGIDLPATAAAGSAYAGTANQVRFILFTLDATWSIAKVAYNITAAVAGSHVAFAIYSADGNTKLVDSGALSGAAIGNFSQNLAAPVLIGPGDYIFAWTADNTGVTGYGISAYVGVPGGIITANQTRYGSVANPSAAGVMPAQLGVLTVDVSFNEMACFWSS
jgi:hypothetical protein